jgi:phage terminase large subunit-like protein
MCGCGCRGLRSSWSCRSRAYGPTPSVSNYFDKLAAAPRRGRPRKSEAELAASSSWRLPAKRKDAALQVDRARIAARPKPRRHIADPEAVILELPGYDPHRGADGFRFDAAAARAAIAFIHQRLTHTRGEWGLRPLELERWQQAIVANICGWKDHRGLRRYRQVFIGVPRKNGKTTVAGGLVNLFACTDDEPGAELYSAAADREQARLVYSAAAGMVRQDLELADRARIYHNSIVYDGGRATYKVLSAVAGTKHGFNGHLVVVDELHAHKNRELVDVLVTSTGARRQPLVVYITTSDFDRPSICNETWDYFARVRDGVIDDPTSLPCIWEAARSDDWRKREVWKKANPNYGVSVKPEYLERQFKKACEVPAYENTFRRVHLNQRTEQDVRLISLADWDRCNAPPEPVGPCYVGLDLSSTTDLTALVLYFPVTYSLLPFFFVPGECAEVRERRDKVPYCAWARAGHIELTQGNVIDYDLVERRVLDLRPRYEVVDVAVDPWNAAQLQQRLIAAGLTVVTFAQTFADFNGPTKELLRLLAAGLLRHGGHPVLRWCAANVAGETDSHGNVRPSKRRSTEKIDGIVAGLMGIGRATAQPAPLESVYEKRGLLLL